jgi:hypothetical protein
MCLWSSLIRAVFKATNWSRAMNSKWSKEVTLYTKDTSVFCEIGHGYMLYLANEEVISKMSARDIILLIDLCIVQHVKGCRPS